MGALNSRAMGEIALAYGDNEVYPSPLLTHVLRMQVDSDKYRRRFHVANASKLTVAPEQTRRYKFRPGELVSWLVHSGDVINDQATKLVNVIVSLIDPENASGSVVWAQHLSHEPGRLGIFIPLNDNSGTQEGFDHGPLYVPAGYELDIAITATVAPFEPSALLTSLYLEEVPRQIDISKLEPTEILTT